MTRAEKLLYHQIHPLKLLTDFTTSFASCWLLWQACWLEAALVGFVPSVIVTLWLLGSADLGQLKHTPMGRYVTEHMTRGAVGLRSSGQAVMWLGAGTHVPWLMPLGFMVIVFGWMQGMWAPARD